MFIENARVLETEHVAGSIAELGVYKGTTAKLLHELLPGRTLWLFDTFEGFDARDLPGEKTVRRMKRYCSDSGHYRRAALSTPFTSRT
jgi:Macrocin-O-methyltransferase (TylF)